MDLICGRKIHNMVNITNKSNSLRIAIASATVRVSRAETIEAVQQRKVPKGEVFEFARAAGLLAIKKTSDLIPDCHPLPVEFAAISYQITGLTIVITVEVHTIYKTGVEVEAMHGASLTALTMYDMLKPIDKGVEIESIRLLHKSGGKSDINTDIYRNLTAAVVVCSDSIARGQGVDSSGKAIIANLQKFQIETIVYEVIEDDFEQIQSKVKMLSPMVNLLIFSGGTGLSPRDVTVDAVSPLIERSIDGIMERARQYGQERMPYAMLSRGIAGLVGDTLVLTLPGSVSGVQQSMDAMFPQILHVFKVLEGTRH